MKKLQPLPHAIVDYVFAAKMIAAPWLFGFQKNQAATMSSVGTGVAIAGLSLLTDYPLGAAKLIPFPTHGVIEAAAGTAAALAPWLLGFDDNKRATWLHVAAGAATLAVVAVTDYQAAKRQPERSAISARDSLRYQVREPEMAA